MTDKGKLGRGLRLKRDLENVCYVEERKDVVRRERDSVVIYVKAIVDTIATRPQRVGFDRYGRSGSGCPHDNGFTPTGNPDINAKHGIGN